MKNILSALFVLFACATVKSDIFIGPTTPSNRLIIGAGQVAVISEIYAQKMYDNFLTPTNTVPLSGNLISNGVTTTIYIGELKNGTTALVGPVELTLSSSGVIRFQILSNTPINCLIVKPGTTNVIDVPAGKSVRFMSFDLSGFN